MGFPPYAPHSFFPYSGCTHNIVQTSNASKFQASHGFFLPITFTASLPFVLVVGAFYCLFLEWGLLEIQLDMPFADVIATLSLVASSVYLLHLLSTAYVQSFAAGRHVSLCVEGGKRIPSIQATTIPASAAQAVNYRPILSGRTLKNNNDDDIAHAVSNGTLPSHSLEAELGNAQRAVSVRKRAVELMINTSLKTLPLDGFDYASVLGQCCEMVIGYVQIPVGVAGPLLLDGLQYMVPMATTEGCLVASTNRGCKAIHMSGGAFSVLLRDGMTRAPIVRFARAQRTAELKFYVEDANNWETLRAMFNRTSRFARLQRIQCILAGRNLYMRFVCSTGDAMGMNMVSKGVQSVLEYLQHVFLDMEIISISGNVCADKKAAAINWIEGRGKSVVCEAIIKGEVVAKVLKTTVAALVELNMLKNLAGSAVAVALGGYNAHAANIVTAIFIATGQDPAQNVESSQCITLMESINDGKDLHVSVSMPSIEVGTVGGGTQLASQSACLNLLGIKGSNKESPGANAQCLARVVAGAVLAGELSLMSALAAGHLVNSHMRYNRASKSLQQDAGKDEATKDSMMKAKKN